MKGKGKGGMLGGYLPYVFVGTCWLLLVISFLSSTSDHFGGSDTVTGSKTEEQEGEQQWDFQCSTSSILEYTPPPRASGYPSAMDPAANCTRQSALGTVTMVTAKHHRPPRRPHTNRITASDFVCSPCKDEHFHSVFASLRRQFYIESDVTYYKNELTDGNLTRVEKQTKNVFVALNPDVILVSASEPRYNHAAGKFQSGTTAPLIVLPLPQMVRTTIFAESTVINITEGLLAFSTDWAGEARAFLRTLFALTKSRVKVEQCDGSEGACFRICPPQAYPVLPCGSPQIRGTVSDPVTRNEQDNRLIKMAPHRPSNVAFCLVGLIRSIQFSGTDLFNWILKRHEQRVHVYVSTWNIIGQMQNGVFGFADKLAPAVDIQKIVMGVFENYLKNVDVLKYEDYKPMLESYSTRQGYAQASHHIHIPNVLRMLRAAEAQSVPEDYEIVVISRLDISFRGLVQFIAGGPSRLPHVKVTYDPSSEIAQNTVRLDPGTVAADIHGTEFDGQTNLVSSWVLAGTYNTMMRFEGLHKYCTDNFVPGGLRETLGAFMSENGMYVHPLDYNVYRDIAVCDKMSPRRVQEKQWPEDLYDEAHGCYRHIVPHPKTG